VANIYGIEAARRVIVTEIANVFAVYGQLLFSMCLCAGLETNDVAMTPLHVVDGQFVSSSVVSVYLVLSYDISFGDK